MYVFTEIRQVHLEVTERCNAACAQCPRRIDGGAMNPKVTGAELSLGDIRLMLRPEFVAQLTKIYLCGNYGDPAAATDTLEIVRYLRDCSRTLRIGIHSNGSLRNTDWWRDLARAIGENGYARFAIDGLEDTNHIYRRNTDWAKIMQNAAAYLAAGGRAEWDFIVFAHNEHQVEAARVFAAERGFAAFNVKRTARFLDRVNLAYATESPVKNTRGETVATLARPTSQNYHNEALEALESERTRHPDYDTYLAHRTISCKVQADKSIYVSAGGQVFPCCWLAAMLKNPDSSETRQFATLFPEASVSQIVSSTTTLQKIVAGSLIAHSVPAAWVGPGKLKTCARVCGQ